MRKYTLLLVGLLAGCASTNDYRDYLTAQAKADQDARQNQKPLVELVAHAGQPITGLASLRVYAPVAATSVQQARPNEWAGVVSQVVGVTGTVLGIKYAGDAAIGLASSVGSTNAAIAGNIQAPGAVTTNNMTGSTGVLGSGTYGVDSTHVPTVVNPVVVTQPAPVQVPVQVVNPVVVNPVVVTP